MLERLATGDATSVLVGLANAMGGQGVRDRPLLDALDGDIRFREAMRMKGHTAVGVACEAVWAAGR